MERHEIIVPHVPPHTRGRQDDDVFACHVSDAGHDRAWYVPRPHGTESLQLHPMWSHWVSQKRVLFGSSLSSRLPSPPKRTTMSNRLNLLSMIHTVMTKIKNAASREQRFDLLENAQILSDILKEVTQYENSLLMDLEVD